MYLDRPDYDELKRREAIVTGMFLQQAEQLVEEDMLDQVRYHTLHGIKGQGSHVFYFCMHDLKAVFLNSIVHR